jgi:hypothetical protein
LERCSHGNIARILGFKSLVKAAHWSEKQEAMKLTQLSWLLLFAAQAMLLSGCATSAVWRAGQFARYCEPAAPPGLALFHSSQRDDVLVEYSEGREGDNPSIHPRAYWLHENAKQIMERRQPKFVSPGQDQGLVAIPVLQASEIPDPTVVSGRYALLSTNSYAFTLYTDGKEEGSYELPVHPDTSGRTKQILLTPPAVIADTAMLAGVAALVSLPWLWTSLNDWVH